MPPKRSCQAVAGLGAAAEPRCRTLTHTRGSAAAPDPGTWSLAASSSTAAIRLARASMRFSGRELDDESTPDQSLTAAFRHVLRDRVQGFRQTPLDSLVRAGRLLRRGCRRDAPAARWPRDGGPGAGAGRGVDRRKRVHPPWRERLRYDPVLRCAPDETHLGAGPPGDRTGTGSCAIGRWCGGGRSATRRPGQGEGAPSLRRGRPRIYAG